MMTSVHCRPEGYSSNIFQYCDSQFVRESMDKREHSYIVGGNVNWSAPSGHWVPYLVFFTFSAFPWQELSFLKSEVLRSKIQTCVLGVK